MTRKLSMVPVREMTAETTTAPCTLAALAIAGYTGRMGVRIIPAETPVEMGRGLEARGEATAILATPVEGPELKAAGMSAVIPVPMRAVAGASSGGEPRVGWNKGK
jgi:hypothetical protein